MSNAVEIRKRRSIIDAILSVNPLACVTAVVLLKAALFFVVLPQFPELFSKFYGTGFADDYDRLAKNLSDGNGYRFSRDTAVTLAREPGYPIVLSVLFTIFGYGITAARVANLIFGFLSALFIVKLSERISNDKSVSLVAPLAFLLHPGVVVSEMRGGVESLFMLLLLAFFLSIYKAVYSRKFVNYFLSGIILGVASSVRSTALLFPLFLFIYFLVWERSPRPSLWLMLSRVAVIFTGAFLVLTPWIVRNYLLVDKFVPTASVQGVAAHAGNYICTHLSLDNTLRDVDWDAAVARTNLARAEGYRFKEDAGMYYVYFYNVKDEMAFNSFLGKQVLKKYQDSPSLILKCASKNAFNFWFAGKNWTATGLNIVIQLPYIILALGGLFWGLRGAFAANVGILLLFIVYTLGVYLPIHSQARYSIPLVPLLSLLGAVFVVRYLRARPLTI